METNKKINNVVLGNEHDKKNAFSTLITSILEPSRLEALHYCDRNIISYNPSSFFLVFHIRGRNFTMIARPLMALILWDIGWIFLLDKYPRIRRYLYGDDDAGFGTGIEDLVAPLLTPVSFLLVFRLGRAAIRYWDARSAMGRLIENSRTFISTAIVHVNNCSSTKDTSNIDDTQNQSKESADFRKQPHTEESLIMEEISRWTCAFPIAVKNFLRPDSRRYYSEEERIKRRRTEIGSLLSDDDTNEMIRCTKVGGDKSYATIMVLNRLRHLAHRASLLTVMNSEGSNISISTGVYRQLNEQIDTLTGAWGTMERINATPLPYVYVIHLRTFLLLYLFLWHAVAVADLEWRALLPTYAASWALLGIEAAAVECERPFKWHSNHLALGKMCIVIANNVAQTVQIVGTKK